MIITAQHVHAREWMRCPMCEGRPLTPSQARAGFQCGTCYNKGEIPRRCHVVRADNSSFYERQAGA